jgi:hypothetical protein
MEIRMNLSHLMRETLKTIKDNSPAILTAVGVSGVISTAYLTGRATFKAAYIIRDYEGKFSMAANPRERFKERAKLVWKLYIPPAISGVSTILSIVSATRISSRKAAVITTAYSLSERAFSEYRDKVIEKFGEGKERALRDDIAQDRVNNNPPKELIVAGSGTVLCHEALTGRFFMSDHETLRQAQNTLNAKILAHNYAYLDDFYDLIGLPYTSVSNSLGWEVGKLMELRFTTVLSPDNKPCLSFEYNYTRPV